MAAVGLLFTAHAGSAAAEPAANVLGVRLAPGTAGLTPQLAIAYTVARSDAQRAGVGMHITSGKRSWAEQTRMWRDGVRRYGSAAEASRWVLPPSRSTHVTGRAIDVGARRGAAWLERYGFRYGLCRTFDNEWWHFELTTMPGARCGPRVPDASRR
jgi:D-alanyl-D-alanine carboxypeptidase